jgi:Na+/proline symporter
MGLLGGPLLGLFFLGVFVPRVTARGAVAGWLMGFAVVLYVCFGTRVSFLWYTLTGCATTMCVAWLVSLFGPLPDPRRLAGLTWSSRPQGPPAN